MPPRDSKQHSVKQSEKQSEEQKVPKLSFPGFDQKLKKDAAAASSKPALDPQSKGGLSKEDGKTRGSDGKAGTDWTWWRIFKVRKILDCTSSSKTLLRAEYGYLLHI